MQFKGAPERFPEARGHWAGLVVLGVVILLAVVLRLMGASGDLWFDEIWSLNRAKGAESIVDVLFGIQEDNNHWLNSLYLRMVPDSAPSYKYRAFSLATGLATLLLVSFEGLRRGVGPAITAAILFGFCYILIHFDSEARGYGPAVFFGVASYFALREFFRGRNALWGGAFAITATLGVLSQLTFVWVYTGFFMWTISEWRTRRGKERGDSEALGGKEVVGLHLLPIVVLFSLLLFDVRNWTVGGSGSTPIGQAMSDLVTFTLGVGGPQWFVLSVGALSFGILAGEIRRQARHNRAEALFLFTVLVAGPLAFVGVMVFQFFYPRYVLVSIPFALLIFARFLDRLSESSRMGTWFRVALLVGFMVGGVAQTVPFLEHGRGAYRSAIQHVIRESDPGPIRVSLLGQTVQDPVVEFHAARVPEGHRVQIHHRASELDQVPHWVFLQRSNPESSVPDEHVFLGNLRFTFDLRLPHAGASGWTWDVYRLEPSEQ